MTVVHGGLDEAELRALGIDPAGVLDLSANLHPAGPSPTVLEAARSARLDRYAPAEAPALRAAMAAHEGVPVDWILPTPGATAAIHLIARAFLRPGLDAVVVGPTFGEYEAAVHAVGASVVHVTGEAPAFALPRVLPEGRLVYIANPNNPTGSYLARPALEQWLAPGRTLVVDAAYEAFVPDGWDAVDLVREGADALVIRSMTKLHAIPGLRLGYVVASPEVITSLAAFQHSWSLDAVAQAVGPVALAEHAERVVLLHEMWEARERILVALRRRHVRLGPSTANFILAEVSSGSAAAARLALLREGILVRDGASFGLPAWVRVAVPGTADEERVVDALVRVLAR